MTAIVRQRDFEVNQRGAAKGAQDGAGGGNADAAGVPARVADYIEEFEIVSEFPRPTV
jgi:hypothetical protein